MRFSGKSGGQDVDMTMAFSGKRLGGKCDSEEQVKAMKAQVCDTSRYQSTADWIGAPTSSCNRARPAPSSASSCATWCARTPPGMRKPIAHCKCTTSTMLGGVSIAKECKLNMAATTKSICKKLNGKNYSKLSAHCPAEAKTYREDKAPQGMRGPQLHRRNARGRPQEMFER